jgi:hypothetical protein
MLWLTPSVPKHGKAKLMNSIENSDFRAANISLFARPSGRAVYGVALRPLACWNCGFESHREWMDICLLCVLSGWGLCDELITRPEDSYRLWCGVVCYLETSWMRRPWPTGKGGGGCCVIRNKIFTYVSKMSAHVGKKWEFQVLWKLRYVKVVHTITHYLRFNLISYSYLLFDPPLSLYNF